MSGPRIAPVPPPAMMGPKRRFASWSRNTSTMKLQNTDTTNMLKTDSQTKNAAASPRESGISLEEDVEHQQVGGEETVCDRQQQRLAHARHERPEQRRQQQHDREGADVEPEQVLHDAARHRVAQRPQQVVGAEQHEEVGEREADRSSPRRAAREGASRISARATRSAGRAAPARCGRPLSESFSTKTRLPSPVQCSSLASPGMKSGNLNSTSACTGGASAAVAERRQRARHRPHAVRDGAIESEQLRAAVAEMDRVEVAGQPAVTACPWRVARRWRGLGLVILRAASRSAMPGARRAQPACRSTARRASSVDFSSHAVPCLSSNAVYRSNSWPRSTSRWPSIQLCSANRFRVRQRPRLLDVVRDMDQAHQAHDEARMGQDRELQRHREHVRVRDRQATVVLGIRRFRGSGRDAGAARGPPRPGPRGAGRSRRPARARCAGRTRRAGNSGTSKAGDRSGTGRRPVPWTPPAAGLRNGPVDRDACRTGRGEIITDLAEQVAAGRDAVARSMKCARSA